MTSLLDSQVHHHHIRILSRKLCESAILDEEPPNRRIPTTLPQLSGRTMRSVRDNHESDIHDMVPPGERVHTVHFDSSDTDQSTGRQRSQMQCWQRRRNDQNEALKIVSLLLHFACAQAS